MMRKTYRRRQGLNEKRHPYSQHSHLLFFHPRLCEQKKAGRLGPAGLKDPSRLLG
jgi:hypothetical protein